MGKGSRTRQANTLRAVETTREAAAPARSVGKTIRNVLIGLLVAAFVGVGIFGILSETGVLLKTLTAFEVGGQKISAKDYKVFYKTSEMNLINNYGSMLQAYYGVDLSRPLETQAYGDGTWGDYLHEDAQNTITDTYALYQKALDNGYTLADDNDPTYLGQMAVYRSTADLFGMDLETYTSRVYGSEVKLADLQRVAKITATARNYYNDQIEAFGVSDADIQAYYKDNSSEFDRIDYRSFVIPYETVSYSTPEEGEEPEDGAPESQEEADAMTEENRKAAQAIADEFLGKVTDERSFISLAKEYAENGSKDSYDSDDATLTRGASLNTYELPDVVEWSLEDGRKTGDKTTLDTGSSVAVVYFVNRYLPEEKTVTVRHILLRADEADEEATEDEKAAADEALAAAEAKINEIHDTWLSGEKTEDSFALLAYEYSEDVGSVPDGGLIENFSEGAMVAEFNDWCFDSSRQSGDTEVVKTDYGYHLIYFVGEGETAWKVTARSNLENEKVTEMLEALREEYPTKGHNYAMSLVY